MKNCFTRLTALLCAAAILLCSLPMQALAAEFQPQIAYEDSLPNELPVQEEAPAAPEEPEAPESAEQLEPAADASAEPEAAPEELAIAVLSTGNKSGNFTYSVLSDNTAQITGYSGSDLDLTIPAELDGHTVSSIGYEAFYRKKTLGTVNIPDDVTTIKTNAFRECTALKSIHLPAGLTTIEAGAFTSCSSLESVQIPDTVEAFGANAFGYCTSLTEVNYPKKWRYVWTSSYIGSPFEGCTKLTSITVPEGVTAIPNYAFYYSSIQRISLPSTLTTIGSEAFRGANLLQTVNIPNGVTTIKTNAFRECTGLIRIVLPVAIERINDSAFAGCTKLQQVAFLGTRCSFGGSVFRNSANVSFYCPMVSEEALYAIENGIPIVLTGGIQDDPKSVLDYSDCSYFAELGSMAANGLVSVTVRYAVKDSMKAAVKDKSLRLYLPRTAELYEQTLKLDGVLCTEYTYDGGRVLTIPVEKDSGTLKFSLHVTAQGNLFSYAALIRTKDGASGKDIIGILNDSVNVLTLNALDTVTTASVTVSGLAPASAEVKLSVNGSAQQTVTASKAGSWSATVTLPSPEDYHSYTILAECQSGDSLMQRSAAVTYHAEEPTVTDFKMYYNENGKIHSCDLLQLGSVRPKVYFLPGKEFRFELKLDHPEQINTLYVTSTRSNEVRYLQATYDEERGLFTTNGYFDENDHRYVPGAISYEYTKKITPVTVDTSYDWSVFDPQLPSDKKDAIRFSQYTDSDCTAQIDLGSVCSDLNDVVVDAEVSVYDELTDGDLKDWLGEFKDFDKMDSYLVPGKDGEKFYVTMDTSDPYSNVLLVWNMAGSKFIKLILKEKLDNTQNLDTAWSLVKISSALSTVSTITNVMYKQYSIEKDMDKLREEVLQTSYGTPQQRQEALRQVDALEQDQSAFMLLTTLLPLVVAAAPIALGATMSAAPAILFTALLGVFTAVAPMFWELRTAQIKGQTFRVDFVVDPSGYVYDRETNERLEGVKATAYYIPEPENATEAFWKNTPAANTYGELWNGEEYNQSNPLYTNVDGKYAWNVPFGWWRVKYEKEGYETAWSDWMTVPPERTEVNIGLKPIAPEYTVRAESVTADHVSVRVTSGSAAKQTARCVLAAYDTDGRLTATAVQTLSPGSTAELTLSGLSADSTVKLFILNSTTGEPLRRSWSSALQAA